MDNNESKHALEQWVKDYTEDLYSWAYHKTYDVQTAEDLVQETFLVAAVQVQRFRNESQPRTWLFGILKNKIAEHFRTKSKHPQTHVNDDQWFDHFFTESHWNPEAMPHDWNIQEDQLFDNGDFIRIFELCMKKLPAQWFACVSMKYLEEKDPKIVCQELDLSTTNYWQIVHRAKLNLRECLEKNWFKK